MMPVNEHEIIGRIRQRDEDAFRTLVEEYRQHAFNLAFRIVCDEEEAKDIVQESFIKVWQKIDTYEMDLSFQSWFSKIVSNSAIDRMRQLKRHNTVKIEQVAVALEKLLSNPESQEKEMDNLEIASLIRWLAEGLPEKQKLVFILRDLQGADSAEVQEMLRLSDRSVKSNLYHARQFIRRKLKNAL